MADRFQQPDGTVIITATNDARMMERDPWPT